MLPIMEAYFLYEKQNFSASAALIPPWKVWCSRQGLLQKEDTTN